MVELIGYGAMLCVAASFLFKDLMKLRLLNSFGAVLFVVYGVLLGSYPVIGLNLFIVGVNSYYIYQSNKKSL